MSNEQTTFKPSPELLAAIERRGPLTQADLDHALNLLYKPGAVKLGSGETLADWCTGMRAREEKP